MCYQELDVVKLKLKVVEEAQKKVNNLQCLENCSPLQNLSSWLSTETSPSTDLLHMSTTLICQVQCMESVLLQVVKSFFSLSTFSLSHSLSLSLPSSLSLSPLPPSLSPDDFFQLSIDEIHREQKLKSEAIERDQLLRTKAMRERDETRTAARYYRYTLLRVRLPDGLFLQGLWWASFVHEKHCHGGARQPAIPGQWLLWAS